MYIATVQLNLNFTHVCRYTCVLARLMCAKLQKLACAHTVACGFGMCLRDSKHTRHMRDAHQKLTLGLPHYTCGVRNYRHSSSRQRNTTALQLIGFFICCNEHHLIILLKKHGHTEYSRISSYHWWIRSSIAQCISVSLKSN